MSVETWVGAADEMRLGLMSQVRRVWAPRGVKVVQRIEMARQWRYLALVVNMRLGRIVWAWIPSMRKEAIAEAVEAWRAAGVQGVVWDRAGGHRSLLVRQLGLKLVEQPSYSPELNRAERVIEELRRGVEGKLYASLELKVAAVEAELRALAADPERIKRLTGWHWFVDAVESLSDNTALLS